MREIMQFKSTKERLKYLSGGFEEIVPVEVKETEPKEVENEHIIAKNDEKSQKKALNVKKTTSKSKKGKKNGEVQAE